MIIDKHPGMHELFKLLGGALFHWFLDGLRQRPGLACFFELCLLDAGDINLVGFAIAAGEYFKIRDSVLAARDQDACCDPEQYQGNTENDDDFFHGAVG